MELTITKEAFKKHYAWKLEETTDKVKNYLLNKGFKVDENNTIEFVAMLNDNPCFQYCSPAYIVDGVVAPTGYPSYYIYTQGHVRPVETYERDFIMSEATPEKIMGHTPHDGMWLLKYKAQNKVFLEVEYTRNGVKICETKFAEFIRDYDDEFLRH